MMNGDVVAFVKGWVLENVNADAYPDERVPDPRAVELAERVVADAREAGISRKQLENEYGNLAAFMRDRMIQAADKEVQRLSSRDD